MTDTAAFLIILNTMFEMGGSGKFYDELLNRGIPEKDRMRLLCILQEIGCISGGEFIKEHGIEVKAFVSPIGMAITPKGIEYLINVRALENEEKKSISLDRFNEVTESVKNAIWWIVGVITLFAALSGANII